MYEELTLKEKENLIKHITWDVGKGNRFETLDDLIKEMRSWQRLCPLGGFYGHPYEKTIDFIEKNRTELEKKIKE